MTIVTCCLAVTTSVVGQGQTITVNQPLFTTTLFRNLPDMNWIAVTTFHNQAISTPVFFLLQLYGRYWSAARNICSIEALVNLIKMSRTRIKIGFTVDNSPRLTSR